MKTKALFCILILKSQHLVGSVAIPQRKCGVNTLQCGPHGTFPSLLSFFLFAVRSGFSRSFSLPSVCLRLSLVNLQSPVLECQCLF